ncbi:hypothetical protein RB2501_00891 [Robiginitalea biformata HTCC2501]|uniref:Uncharacterized protein n=1 Tax=Robiginitalea biformata (strain ATCC BAA-864 / DSM 15991 / KCTC 12146 / HTCC2501) TaxID=313596 RepID=A4CNX1_ROBBH|nr:hypothetical protein RB2501_00891 [Robiginitalea biformata HTCC2501]
MSRITRAGTPATTVFGGTSLFTSAPAATTELLPTVTPGRMVAPAPIQALFRIITSAGTIDFLVGMSTG